MTDTLPADLAGLDADERRALLARTLRARRGSVPRTGELSSSQERLWFLDQLTPGNTSYNIPSAARVRGPIDLTVWQRALDLVVGRHDALRTVFASGAHGPRQSVDPAARMMIQVIDCSHIDPDANPEAVGVLAQAEFAQPFDLATGPLMRFVLLRFAPQDHLLLFTVHHIVADLWSSALFLGELFEAARAYTAGVRPDLAPVPVQFIDYVRWLRAREANDDGSGLDHWVATMDGAPPVLDLPTDHPRPRMLGFGGGSHPIELSRPVMDAVRALSGRVGVTPFQALLAAYAVWLGRVGRTDDVVLGVPVANRLHPESAGLVGYLANMVPIRVGMATGASFRDVLVTARSAVLNALAHQEVPFERLVERLSPERDASRSPLVQVSFVFEDIAMPTLDLPGVEVTPVRFPSSAARFDLELQLYDGPEVTGTFEFNAELFESATIAGWAASFETLVAELAAHPDHPLASVQWLAPAEAQRQLTAWNPTPVLDGLEVGLPTLVRRTAAEHPERTAVTDATTRLTYEELVDRTDRYVRGLAAAGVASGDLVGVCLDRTAALVPLLLAVLELGAAYVPLDPEFPPTRLAYMVEDSHLRVVIVDETTRRLDWADGVRLVGIDGIDVPGDRMGTVPVDPDSAAYVIYTSGSTGNPKGVVVLHRGVTNFLRSMVQRPGLQADDNLLAVTTLSFDISVLELFAPLLCGANVVLAGAHDAGDPRVLAETMERERITVMQATPSTWRLLLESGWRREGLKALTGGEALPADLAADLLRAGAELWNMYGPTETTVWSSVWRVTPGPIALGDPVANTDLYVLDDALLPVPQGVAGELWIGGQGLAAGYLDRPELTAERFRPSPHPGNGERIYRTGDLVRRRHDGALEFLGRIDHQVKLRGHRIELGEIEARLAEVDGVGAAVAVVREDSPGQQQLVAYVVPEPDAHERGVVEGWAEIWSAAYTGDDVTSEDDFSGWTSSYTGEPLPAEQLAAWADASAALVLDGRPGSVLEIGVGTGLILGRVAPRVDRYWGIDVSARVLEQLGRRVTGLGLDADVRLFECPADGLADLPEGTFDAVVINSVAQYFPSGDYLARVVAAAYDRVAPGGSLVLGDLRSLPLQRAFRLDVERLRLGHNATPAELRAALERGVENDRELTVAPLFIQEIADSLPDVRDLRITPRRGLDEHEMNAFRFDAVLRRGDGPPAAASTARALQLTWHRGAEAEFAAMMRDPDVPALELLDVPNRRTAVAAAAVVLLDGEQLVSAGDGEHPDELVARLSAPGWNVFAEWSAPGPLGEFSVVAQRRGAEVDREPRRQPADAPRFRDGRRSDQALVATVRASLAETLPDYMVPNAFMVLSELPLTPNGKVDRRALPAVVLRGRAQDHVAPRSEEERRLVALFSEVLNAESVGVLDSFFDLGGHSLLATRLVARIRDAFGVDLPVRAVFEAPTPSGLARRLARSSEGGGARPVPVPRDGDLPLSFAQQRLWFLHELAGPSATYNMVAALRYRGAISVDALFAALGDVIARHEVLRTVYPVQDGTPRQRILPAAEAAPAVRVVDQPEADLDAAVTALARETIDVTGEPPLRATVLRIGERDHVLVLVVHHIACDGWSLAPLQRDLETAYEARVTGLGPWTGDPLPVQYADFSAWQRAQVGDRDDAESLAAREIRHWRARLADLPERLELPTDRPHPTQASGEGGKLGFAWGAADLPGFDEAVRALETTPAIAGMTGLGLALDGLGAGSDIPLGFAVAGRDDERLDTLVGCFVNTLVLRLDTDQPTLRRVFGMARARMVEALDHQDLPFEMLVDAVSPERTLSHHPVVQVLVAWQNYEDAASRISDVQQEVLDVDTGSSRMDLVFTITERREGGRLSALAGEVEYNTDVFDAATVRKIVETWRRVLVAALAAPDAAPSELPLIDEATRERVLHGFNRASDGRPGLVTDLWAATVARHGSRPALEGADGVLTYREADQAGNRLARVLAAHGIGSGDAVALLMHRSVDLVVAEFAVLKLGAAFVPMDAEVPAERLAGMIEDVEASLTLAHADLVDRLPAAGPVLILDAPQTRGELEAASDEAITDAERRRPATAEDAAYVLFTSGSTGRPKGVEVPHRGLVSLAHHQVERFGVRPDSRVLQLASPAFDNSWAEIGAAMAAGATLVVPPSDRPLYDLDMGAFLADRTITEIHLSPSMLRALGTPHLPGLERIIVGGEALTPDVVDRWGRHGRLFNTYGPTEATITATVAGPIEAPEDHNNIGVPVPGNTAYVLDRLGRPVPPGIRGELHLGGVGLALGYVGRPDLTEAAFVPNPFGAGTLYRTGDLVSWTDAGELLFHGRVDDQVQINGQRVEPAEVQAAVARCPGISGAAVAVLDAPSGGQALVAYVVPAGGDVDVDDLQARVLDDLAVRLPRYMLPAAVVALPAIPLTGSGKLDRRALPSPEAWTGGRGRAARGEPEERVAALFAEILGRESVPADRSFFELGGDSLAVVRLVAAAQRDGLGLSARDVLLDQTVEALAARASGHAALVIPRRPAAADAPLTLAQENGLHEPYPLEDPQHNIVTGTRLTGPLDRERLRTAFDRVVARHEALRTRFVRSHAGELRQVIDPAAGWPWHTTDLRAATASQRDAAAEELLCAELARPFDLAGEWPIRAHLLRFGDAEHGLVMNLHHSVVDPWAMERLQREVEEVYAALGEGREPRLAELGIQYADLAVWQRSEERSRAVAANEAHWRAVLDAHDALEFPAPGAGDGSPRRVHLDDGLVSAARAFAAREGGTLFTTLLTAYGMAVAGVAERDDLIVTHPVAGREHAQTHPLVGFFVHLVGVGMRALATARPVALHAHVAEGERLAQVHQEASLRAIAAEGGRLDSLRVVFNLIRYAEPGLALAGVEATPVAAPNAGDLLIPHLVGEITPEQFDLYLMLHEDGEGGVAALWMRDPASIDDATLDRLVDGFEGALTRLVGAPAESPTPLAQEIRP